MPASGTGSSKFLTLGFLNPGIITVLRWIIFALGEGADLCMAGCFVAFLASTHC